MNGFSEPYRVLMKVYAEGAHLKIALASASEKERARTVKIAYGVLENDAYLSLCIGTFAPRSPKLPVRIVLKIALYALLYLGHPRYAVTDLAVDLLKEIGKGGAAGFVNAVLRNFDAEKVHLPAGDEGLAVKYNFPLFGVKRMKAQYGARAEAILAARSHGVSVRFERGLDRYSGLEHEDTPFEDLKIFKNFVRDEGFFAGDYTFQSVGSVGVAAAVEPCAHLLDACAAPGGKSVLLAKKCNTVTACELHAHRVGLIESYIARMGAENVTAMQKDSTVFDPAWEEKFDGVLVDAPCSGLGTVAENPDLVLRKREEDLPALCALQLDILRNCARYVKRGGMLYYATCSILEEENDGVLCRFLQEAPFVPEAVQSPLPHEKTAYGVQFLPDTAYGAGFFVAKMRKL